MEIQWQEPPTQARKNASTKAFVYALQAFPGKWALYPRTVSAKATIYQYKRNFPGTEWQAVPSEQEEGRFDLYGKWVGTDTQEGSN